MPRARLVSRGRTAVVVGVAVGMLGSMGLSPASADERQVRKYQVCSWINGDKDDTFNCDSRYHKGTVVTAEVGVQCWQRAVQGAYAQERVKGAWTDRPDIAVTVEEDPFCEAGFPFMTAMHISMPAAPFALRTFRVVVPESPEYLATYGDPTTVCVRAKANDRYCA